MVFYLFISSSCAVRQSFAFARKVMCKGLMWKFLSSCSLEAFNVYRGASRTAERKLSANIVIGFMHRVSSILLRSFFVRHMR